jgi:hypothetical protein
MNRIIKNWNSFTNEGLSSYFSKNDNDLGNEIMVYLRDMLENNSNYKSNSNYEKENITRANNGDLFFFYSKQIFRSSGGEYRIDVAKVSDKSSNLHGDPYRVFISKVDEKSKSSLVSDKDFDDLFSKKKTIEPSARAITNISTSKSEGVKKLDLDKSLAKDIYSICEKIWEKTNRNVISTARGGVSTQSNQNPARRRFRDLFK